MVRFGWEQSSEEIFINFTDNKEAIDYLIEEGYLDEEIKDSYYYYTIEADIDYDDGDDYDAEKLVIDAICDWIDTQVDKKLCEYDIDDPFYEETNDVLRAVYIFTENKWFNQFLTYKWGGF